MFGYNDLGMHCMNSDFEDFMILPPFNTLHAQVHHREENPSLTSTSVAPPVFGTCTKMIGGASAITAEAITPAAGAVSSGLSGRPYPNGGDGSGPRRRSR